MRVVLLACLLVVLGSCNRTRTSVDREVPDVTDVDTVASDAVVIPSLDAEDSSAGDVPTEVTDADADLNEEATDAQPDDSSIADVPSDANVPDEDASWTVEDSENCLCENLEDRCLAGECYRPTGGPCRSNADCPLDYQCLVARAVDASLCDPIYTRNDQYCPGEQFPERTCPSGESCDLRGVYCTAPVSCSSSGECAPDAFCHDCSCTRGGRGCVTPEMYEELLSPTQFLELTARCDAPSRLDGACLDYASFDPLRRPPESSRRTWCRLTQDCPDGTTCRLGPSGTIEYGLDWGSCEADVAPCPQTHVLRSWGFSAALDFACVVPGQLCETDGDCPEATQCMPTSGETLYEGAALCGFAVGEDGSRLEVASPRPALRPTW